MFSGNMHGWTEHIGRKKILCFHDDDKMNFVMGKNPTWLKLWAIIFAVKKIKRLIVWELFWSNTDFDHQIRCCDTATFASTAPSGFLHSPGAPLLPRHSVPAPPGSLHISWLHKVPSFLYTAKIYCYWGMNSPVNLFSSLKCKNKFLFSVNLSSAVFVACKDNWSDIYGKCLNQKIYY